MARSRRPSRTTATALAATIALVGGASGAVAEGSPPSGPGMPLGALAPAPEGFLELCERAPAQCPVAGAAPDVATLRAVSNRRFWEAALTRRGVSRSAAPAAAPPAALSATRSALDPAPLVLQIPRIVAIDWVTRLQIEADRLPPPEAAASAAEAASVEAVSAETAGTVALEVAGAALSADAAAAGEFVSEAPSASSAPDPATPAPAPFSLDRDAWRMVNGVNRRLNRDIRRASDASLYGREDHWTAPTGKQAQGDCEDYVLAKRADLIASGVPAEALSIAIVETPWGESHAVLLLASDRGEYVLDSLSPWISRWDRVNYRWRERQAPGRSFDWVSVAL